MRNIPENITFYPILSHYYGTILIQIIDDKITMVDKAPEQTHQMHQICPFCKKQISDKDTLCPHCNNLLIYKYPKQIAAKKK